MSQRPSDSTFDLEGAPQKQPKKIQLKWRDSHIPSDDNFEVVHGLALNLCYLSLFCCYIILFLPYFRA